MELEYGSSSFEASLLNERVYFGRVSGLKSPGHTESTFSIL